MKKMLMVRFFSLSLLGGAGVNATFYPWCSAADISIWNYTISACNIGATIAGTGEESYGAYFQRGNNYPFSNDLQYATMTGRLNSAKPDRRPSTLGYGPGNYYYSGVFVFANQSGSNWSKELNDNLRGGTGTELERQWPCATGYHIPMHTEWQELISATSTLWIFTGTMEKYTSGINSWEIIRYSISSGELAKFLDFLKFPLAWFLARNLIGFQTGNGYARASDADYNHWDASKVRAWVIPYIDMTEIAQWLQYININNPFARAYGMPVRCFKNATPPTQTGNCMAKPEHSERNTVATILQTWDYGTYTFLPKLTGDYSEIASTTECVFKCSGGYVWNAPTSTCDALASSSGGVGVNLKKDNCPNGDFSPSYYDDECSEQPLRPSDTSADTSASENSTGNTQFSPLTGGEGDPTSLGSEEGVVNPEVLTAYQFAYAHDITTLAPIANANPDGTVIRQHLAKMVVNYALNVLWKTLPSKVPAECHWKDGSNAWESQEMEDYAVKACSLGLMGIDMEYFQPYAQVSRAQFWTVLSRLLYGNEYAGGKPYYANHLQTLKEKGILTQIEDPESRIELRQWVRLMLMRSAK